MAISNDSPTVMIVNWYQLQQRLAERGQVDQVVQEDLVVQEEQVLQYKIG